ncbi:lectin-like [Branchiostoma lanceolatum]|uniref:lectin-like n=1 Tax=Branchiostoma lanceolatum TaxID=7740 RepID=UPI0034569D95
MCKLMGAHLVSIKNTRENNFITSFVSGAAKGSVKIVWIGLTNIHKKRPLTWVDGSRVSYTNWNSGEPNNNKLYVWSGEENCGSMYTKTHTHWFKKKNKGQWNDVACDENYPYVCKGPREVKMWPYGK